MMNIKRKKQLFRICEDLAAIHARLELVWTEEAEAADNSIRDDDYDEGQICSNLLDKAHSNLFDVEEEIRAIAKRKSSRADSNPNKGGSNE